MRALAVAGAAALAFGGLAAGQSLTSNTTIYAALRGRTASCSTETAAPAEPGTTTALDEKEQADNARTIIQTGLRLKIPTRGLVVAIATAMQESTLRNLTWGDRDSVGLFQQRNAWGSFAERTDPATAATLFFTGGRAGQRGLLDIPGWEAMPVTRAAQAVQVSAYPDAYAKWEGLARTVVDQVVGGAIAAPQPTCTPEPTASPTAGNVEMDADGNVAHLPGYSNGKIPLSVLAVVPWDRRHHLRAEALAELVPVNDAYRARFGRDICITDSYRTYQQQVDVYARKPGLAARPGTSNHGWATALDLCGGIQSFGSAEHLWFAANAPEHGWRFPPWGQIGGSRPEPWHASWRTEN